jgi:hypothetical protein
MFTILTFTRGFLPYKQRSAERVALVGPALAYGARPTLCAQKRKINVISLAMACPFSRAGSNSQN